MVVGSIALVIFWRCLFAALAPPSPAKSTTPRGGAPGTLTIKSRVTAAILTPSSGYGRALFPKAIDRREAAGAHHINA